MGNQEVPVRTGAAVVVEVRVVVRTELSVPSNPKGMLPEEGPGPEAAHLFSSPPAWIHPARSGLPPTQIGVRESGPTHIQAAAPGGQTPEVLTQVGGAEAERSGLNTNEKVLEHFPNPMCCTDDVLTDGFLIFLEGRFGSFAPD